MNTKFRDFLSNLGFSDEDFKTGLVRNDFEYKVGERIDIKYSYSPTKDDIFERHQILWNKNEDVVFIAVGDEESHLINAKEKPDREKLLKKPIRIDSFNYGINTQGFEDVDSLLISKLQIDSSYFFDFVNKNQRKGKAKTVDKDLLLNLLTLKSNLVDENNSHIVHLLILRCVFIKYLEDRGIFDKNYLLDKLESGKAEHLAQAFDQVAKINGDVFKYDDHFKISDIKPHYLNKIALFFKSDYRSGQQYLFPYRFDQIPIQLISHVYEAFLKTSTKKGDGVYYTPAFLVDFMLERSFAQALEQDINASLLDPAVGSGAFLVQAFKMIENSNRGNLTFEGKKKILENQLFGIDVDRNALQITAFSLYLALLDTEDPSFIKTEIERANPILPSLIGKTLIHANTIIDQDIFTEKAFSCIVSNPPWGSVPTSSDDEKAIETYQKEREAIENKQGAYPEYTDVADYERSQAIMARVSRWGDETTIYSMVVKNSVFLNDKALNFRKYILDQYDISEFYELSHYNKILFKKTPLGVVNGQKMELGASEPCAVLTFQNKTSKDNILNYISPKLTDFASNFEVIHFTSSDDFKLNQSEFLKHDSLWKVLVNADYEAHDLIVNKLQKQKELKIEARAGFQPKREMKALGEPDWKKIIEPKDFQQYVLINRKLGHFNWNQGLHRRRDETIFEGDRILVPVRPLKEDNYLFRGFFIKTSLVHKHNILSLKLLNHLSHIDNYFPYLAMLNSQLIGFIFFQLSSQWGKGEGKRDTLRNIDVERLPFKEITDQAILNNMTQLVETIQLKKSNEELCEKEIDQLNEMVFDLYGLVDYEKEIIREFYDIKVDRAGKKESKVRVDDIKAYFAAFCDAYSLLLSVDHTVNASFHISSNMGTIICFSIDAKSKEETLSHDPELNILHLVKQRQLTKAESQNVLFEEKVKIYDKEDSKFYILKSNQFKDWTVRQAMKDAKEEIDAVINYLPTE